MLGQAVAIAISELIEIGEINSKLFLASRTAPKEIDETKNKKIIRIPNHVARKGDMIFDVIIHCASPSNITKIKDLNELLDVNIGFLKDCTSASTSKIVYISSGEVYGGKSTSLASKVVKPPLDEKRNWYPFAKIETEEYLREISTNTDISVNIVRLFHTFGPGLKSDDGRSFSDIIFSAIFDKEIKLKSSGNQVRSFLYLGDAVRAILSPWDDRTRFNIQNVGSADSRSILEFAEIVGSMTGVNVVLTNHDFEHSPFDVIVPDLSCTSIPNWKPIVSLED
jgi:nucleoside-diphosphate-sugar epimerase